MFTAITPMPRSDRQGVADARVPIKAAADRSEGNEIERPPNSGQYWHQAGSFL